MLRDRCPRWAEVDLATAAARITGQFMTAASTGDLQGLRALLAKDATFTAVGGQWP